MKYNFFTTKELKAEGWMKRQLKLQAEGLCGNLDKVWPDIKESGWFGGKCESWERVPYWLNGFIPLAYLLEDEDLIKRAEKYINAIIANQNESGWICPCDEEERENYDTWAVFLIAKVLCLYCDCSGDERIEGVLKKLLQQFNEHINKYTLRNWGAARWFEGLIAVYWLYGRTQEEWLLTLAKKLRVQGFNWREVLNTCLLDDCVDVWEYYSHIVNITMMLRSEALLSLFDENIDPEELADMAVEYLDKKHGTAIGHFNGDENLSGNSPIQGAELCSIVELMYSCEWLFAITGNVKWADRLEKIAFNSLPAAISPDMWSHQYDQMVNQVASFPMSKQIFRTNNNVAHIFGLEPHFGCCTSNFGQGFPKLALSTFMKSENGIVSSVLLPSKVAAEINGANVICELITDYPFRNTLKYIVKTDSDAEFTLSLRIPSFASKARVDGKEAATGEIFSINRKWERETEIDVELEFETEILKRPQNMVCVARGPLVYSIPIEEKWERVEYTQDGIERKYPYCDYYIYPKSNWNYALASDKFELNENSFTLPFNPKTPPITLTADVAEIEWDFNCGHCDRLPKSRKPIGEIRKVKLIPYGCTNLRITEIPLAEFENDN